MAIRIRRHRPLGTYESESLQENAFSYVGDVHIRGNVTVEEKLVVGGHLVVDGNLEVGELYCVGRVHVKGNITGGDALVGISIHADGNINLSSLTTGKNIDYIASSIGLEEDQAIRDFIARVDPIIADELDSQLYEGVFTAIEVGRDLDCYGLYAHGDVIVGGEFDVDVSEIGGGLSAECIYVEGDLTVSGPLRCRGNISAEELFASDIYCDGNLSSCLVTVDGGDVMARGYVQVIGSLTVADGNIQAGKWITASGRIECGLYLKTGEFLISNEAIITGEDYGIFVGLNLPRSQWMDNGYVSAPNIPVNILSGCFVADKIIDVV